ncbi:MAG: GNAT family N-acetyltransferase [bacterium]|nr:GNAT family N-acetyltransferase [bacterium]
MEQRNKPINLIFQEITENDISELIEVMTRAFDDDTKRHLGEEKGGPEGYDDGEFFRKWLFGYEWTIGYKALTDNKIIGAIIVWIFDSGENYLGAIFVEPDYQNRGVGKQIWDFIESTYPNTKSWQLETPSFAISNHSFYEKCGFKKVGTKPHEVEMPGESWAYRKEIIL